MATTKERMLVTLAPSTARALSLRAKRERTPRATIAARMLDAAIAEEEFEYITPKEQRALAKMLKERTAPGTKYLSAGEADALWRKLHDERVAR
ncbi:MAG: hypothetical protein WDN10_03365 [bacterium]